MIIEVKEDVCLSDHVDLTNNVEQAMHVAVLSFGNWAFGDVDNEDNWILLCSKVETIVLWHRQESVCETVLKY